MCGIYRTTCVRMDNNFCLSHLTTTATKHFIALCWQLVSSFGTERLQLREKNLKLVEALETR